MANSEITEPIEGLAQRLYTFDDEFVTLIPNDKSQSFTTDEVTKLSAYFEAQHHKILVVQNTDQRQGIPGRQTINVTTTNEQQNPQYLIGAILGRWGNNIGAKLRGQYGLQNAGPIPREKFTIERQAEWKEKHLVGYATLSNGYDEVTSSLTGSGNYADQIVIKDYARHLIEQSLNKFRHDHQNDIIAYDADGLSTYRNVIMTAFDTLDDQHLLAHDNDTGNPKRDVIMPDLDSISDADYANRILRNIRISFRTVNQPEDFYFTLNATLDGGLI